jgi:hypothetical protein
MHEFGPGKERFSRHTRRPNVRQELSVFLYFSGDEGTTWTGPLSVLPGVLAWEPDFVQLPSGDLLLLNSTVQNGPQVRQYVRKTALGWIPGPVYDVVSGRAPETVTCTKDGLLVGAVRGGEYGCSNDEGANWHRIAGLPNCAYQPFVTQLPDGRVFYAWHAGGGDEPVGKSDLYVGATTFALVANLPAPTSLTLSRDLSESGDRYINSYTLVLTKGETPVPGKTIHLRYEKRRGGAGELTSVTDSGGRARFDLSGVFAGVSDLHLSYTVRGWFKPEASDASLAPCENEQYLAYVVTTTLRELGWE